jgi:hypothetical protein
LPAGGAGKCLENRKIFNTLGCGQSFGILAFFFWIHGNSSCHQGKNGFLKKPSFLMENFHGICSFGRLSGCHPENAGPDYADFMTDSEGIYNILIHSHLDACIQVIYTIGREIWKRLHGIHHNRPAGLLRRIRIAHSPSGNGEAERTFHAQR